MKLKRILALILSVIMLACLFTACDKGGKDEETSSSEAGNDTESADRVLITVAIKVIDASGKTVYDAPKYVYNGVQPNLITVLEDYLYMEKDIELDYDEFGINAIGELAAGEETVQEGDSTVTYNNYWWYKINGKEGSKALDEYQVQNGDSIEYILTKKVVNN